MGSHSHLSNRGRSRALSVLLSLLGFVGVGIGGLWLHVAVLPLPIETTLGLIARFLYFLLWLGLLIHLLGRSFFGPSSELWQGFIYFLLGAFLGFLGGYFFAGVLGCIFGGLTGVLLGPIVFFTRHRLQP